VSRAVALGIAVAVLLSAFVAWLMLRSRGDQGDQGTPAPAGKSASAAPAPAPSAASPRPCERYRAGNSQVRWVCLPGGAPVDVVTEQSMIVTVLHRPVRALLVETEPLDPAIPIADPKNPPVHVCVLDQPGAGFSGFVSAKAVHEASCRGR
jgi:hypothetical protein